MQALCILSPDQDEYRYPKDTQKIVARTHKHIAYVLPTILVYLYIFLRVSGINFLLRSGLSLKKTASTRALHNDKH